MKLSLTLSLPFLLSCAPIVGKCTGESWIVPEGRCFTHDNPHFEDVCTWNWKGERPVWDENGRGRLVL